MLLQTHQPQPNQNKEGKKKNEKRAENYKVKILAEMHFQRDLLCMQSKRLKDFSVISVFIHCLTE